jgi:tetratricopeptide (TPR) repeat protein
LDRKENQLHTKDGQVVAEVVSEGRSRRRNAAPPPSSARTRPAPSKTDDLFQQGDELCSMGMYEQAIHVWTRILFLEKADARVKAAIEGAKRALSERQRELDEQLAIAASLIDRGDLAGASAKVREVLSADPRNSEGHQLVERIAAKKLRTGSSRALAVSEPAANVDIPAARRGLLLRVSRSAAPRESSTAGGSRLKMAAFVLAAILVFASGALYLYLSWESIISDGAFVVEVDSVGGVAQSELADVPGPSELRYYNGTRLFAKGRYREALAELALVEADSPVAEKARGLILRIEERLLRGAAESQALSDDAVEPR